MILDFVKRQNMSRWLLEQKTNKFYNTLNSLKKYRLK